MSSLGFFSAYVWLMLIYYLRKEIELNDCPAEFKLWCYREFTHYYLVGFPDRAGKLQLVDRSFIVTHVSPAQSTSLHLS